MTEQRTVRLMGVLDGCTNPESAELLPDGETIVFGNCRLVVGLPFFRAGKALVYLRGEAFVSRARLSAEGKLEVEERHLIDGLSATLGCDVLRTDTADFPAGTVFHVAGGGPVTDGERAALVAPEPEVLIYDPLRGALLGRLPLGPDSVLGRRFNGLEQPNGCAVDSKGTLYVGDIPNTNPDPDPAAPPPVPPAVYRIPAGAIRGLVDGVEGAADEVRRVVMPGYVNGLTISPLDDVCWAVSCSVVDPVKGGLYRLDAEAFETGVQPDPVHRDLGVLDGVGVTRRGTQIVSNPRTGDITAFPVDGPPVLLVSDEPHPVKAPADFNVVYPTALGGEPALLVPDIGVGYAPGTASIAVFDLTGL
jgi:hypothetical protein